MVLLTLRTPPYQKSVKSLELQLDSTFLKFVASFHGSHGFALFQPIPAKIIFFSNTLGFYLDLEPKDL